MKGGDVGDRHAEGFEQDGFLELEIHDRKGERGAETPRGQVHAEVNDVKVGTLEHHRDEVFFDFVKFALHRADDVGMLGTNAGGGQNRGEKSDRCLHGARSDQHFGDEDFVGFKTAADVVHADHECGEDLARGQVFGQGLLGSRLGVLTLAGLDDGGEFIE